MTATCACGQAAITVNVLPTVHGVCHCTNCKRRTGTAFGISTCFDKTAVTAFTEKTKVYALQHGAPTHDQLDTRARHFCADCGTPLFWYLTALSEKIGIAGGCSADEALPEPRSSVTDNQRAAWVALPGHWQVSPN